MLAKPRVFVGSSSERKSLAEELCTRLGDKATAIGWWDSPEFQNGFSSLEALLKATETYDFAAFLLTADDQCTSRGVTGAMPRDNVLFEYGLFLGRLRQGRVLAFVEQNIRLPSDVAGIQMERFTVPRDEHERVATARGLTGIVANAIARTPAWWDLHLGGVIAGWSIDLALHQASARLSGHGLAAHYSTFMDRELLLVIRRKDDVVGSMADTQIALGPLRRYDGVEERVRLIAVSPSIIGKAPEGTVIEFRIFVVPRGLTAPKSIEDVVAQGGRLIGGMTETIRRGNAK
jgi:hypothetical protein